jgi:hypothetical protein
LFGRFEDLSPLDGVGSRSKGVSEDGWVSSRCWEVSEWGFGVELSARCVSVGVSRDTKAVGVEDSAMESGMGCGLGRVKGALLEMSWPASQGERNSTRSMGAAHFGQRKHAGIAGV